MLALLFSAQQVLFWAVQEELGYLLQAVLLVLQALLATVLCPLEAAVSVDELLLLGGLGSSLIRWGMGGGVRITSRKCNH